MTNVVTVIVALVTLAAFPGPSVAQQKGQTGTQQQKSQASAPNRLLLEVLI
jgi:hypothetical protein